VNHLRHPKITRGKKLPAWYVPITDKLLSDITARIASACNPERIILFGSYAYGQPKTQSDIDLLIVMNSRKSFFERHKQISGLFPGRLFALDILVKTPREVSDRLKSGDPFMCEVLKRGRILYERTANSRMDTQS